MIIITITISIVYAIILGWLAYTWYKDLKNKQDTDKRILVLEKRDAEKLSKKDFNETIDFLIDNSQQQDLLIESLGRKIIKLERKSKVSK